MDFSSRLSRHREAQGLSQAQLARQMQVCEEIVAFMEDPTKAHPRLEELVAHALDLSVEEFGQHPVVTPESKTAQSSRPESLPKTTGTVSTPTDTPREQMVVARFPRLRAWMFDSCRCRCVNSAQTLCIDAFNPVEQVMTDYLTTQALEYYCVMESSSFPLDTMLAGIHATAIARYSADPQLLLDEERMAILRANLFFLHAIPALVGPIREQFARELERWLETRGDLPADDLNLPFFWDLAETRDAVLVHGPQDVTVKLPFERAI